VALPITAEDAVCAALHLLRLHDRAGDREEFVARLAHEPALAATLVFWRHLDTLALLLLPDERPPENCWTRIEARLGRPH